MQARPDQQPLLAHRHEICAACRQLDLQDRIADIYGEPPMLCFVSSDRVL
jgi:hypothetical protein